MEGMREQTIRSYRYRSFIQLKSDDINDTCTLYDRMNDQCLQAYNPSTYTS